MQCDGCDHDRSRHFRDVDGVVRCLVVRSGTSTSGVIGLPWSTACDCADFKSASTDAWKAREQEESDRRKAAIDRMVAEFRKQTPVTAAPPPPSEDRTNER